jgi:hypothetical protein
MKNWIVPPEIYEPLNKEFKFDFDPCPYPKKEWDGKEIEWGNVNWVNPPFRKADGGPVYGWVKKAIEEFKKGKTCVLIVPVEFWIGHLLKNGAEMRFVGWNDWIDAETGKRNKSAHPHCLFILKEKPRK